MSISINMEPADIERFVKDSIMQSGFGKAIQEGINKSLAGYNNPVDEALRRYVGQVASDLIREKYEADVRAAVARVIEEKVTNELIEKTVDAAVSKMQRAAEGY